MRVSGLVKLLLLSLFIVFNANAVWAEYQGSLVLIPSDCEKRSHCRLGEDFAFVDSQGIGWKAAKGLLTDGASIPNWAQKIVGKPFESSFIKAAVIHDHYCDRRVRPWRQTHKVFYEALLESGVNSSKAGVMYFAVLVGGPKWIKLIPGQPCQVGMQCINQFDLSTSFPGNDIVVGDSGQLFMNRSDLYGTESFANRLSRNIPLIEAIGDEITAKQVEELATKEMEKDFYFSNKDLIGTKIEMNFEIK